MGRVCVSRIILTNRKSIKMKRFKSEVLSPAPTTTQPGNGKASSAEERAVMDNLSEHEESD